MRLLTHNQLMCIRKGCSKSYPLGLEATSVEQEETTVNPAFIAHIMINVDYQVLYDNCAKLGIAAGLPLPDAQRPDWMKLAEIHSKRMEESVSSDDDDDQSNNQTTDEKVPEVDDQSDLLNTLHTVLMDTHVQEGELVCQGCKRHYSIQQGIPNMRLNEDEV